jgi:SAM-dependent methyltransferase
LNGNDTPDWNQRMREDWDRRAREDAESYIYTGESDDFARSGEANYKQLVRPYLPILLFGRRAHDCRVVEIGCGIGRMSEWFAREFGLVEAVDVSPVMIERARRRLRTFPNITFHAGNGSDLAPIADSSADLVFSYIVFQHIPSQEAIEGYVRDAARVLKDGGAFKFQVNGDISPAYAGHVRDTWLGEVFLETEISAMLTSSGFSLLASEGAGTQYHVVTAIKGDRLPERSYVLPGEAWADDLLLKGFGPAVDASWRPMAGNARVRVEGHGSRVYMGLYFWPESCEHRIILGGHAFEISTPGDHYFECPGKAGEIDIRLEPEPARAPAFRVIGLCDGLQKPAEKVHLS